MSRHLDHVLAFARTQTWAIRPDYAQTIAEVLARRAAGIRLSDWEHDELLSAKRFEREAQRGVGAMASRGGVQVIPILGVLSARAGAMEQTSGMVSHEEIAQALRAADADPAVRTILLDINSPGGTVAGTPELAAVIRGLGKNVVAQVNYMAASAAYWLAAQCNEIVVSPSGEVGSIGVVQMHEDVSGAAAQKGVKVSFITAGKFKAEGNPYEPLSDDARAEAQRGVDEAYAMFVKDVALGRGVTKSTARGPKFGEGRMFSAETAVERGLADKVATFEDTVTRLSGNGRVAPRRSATTFVPEGVDVVTIAELSASADVVPVVATVDETRLAVAAPESVEDTDLRERELSITGPRSRERD